MGWANGPPFVLGATGALATFAIAREVENELGNV